MQTAMPPGLIRRNGRYSLRRVIPLDLQPHYGRREIVQALGTADPAEARKRHAKAWHLLDLKFDQDRRELGAAPQPQATPQTDAPHRYASMTGADLEFELKAAHAEYLQNLEDDAEEEETEELQRKLEARLRDPSAALTDEERAVARLLRHHAGKAEIAEEQAAIARSQAPAPDAKPTARKGKTPLTVVVDRWAAEMKPKARTITRTRNIVERFEAVNGAIPVEEITKHHVIAFKDALLGQDQSAANINVMIPMLGTVLIYAVDKLHLIDVNPAARIRVADKRKAKEKRRAFSEDELKRIFASPVYASDLRPAAGGGEAAYWLPLLSLYTGARQTELGQLHPDDVVQETYRDADDQEREAWVIRIVENADRGQFVKTEGSERRVPVHADLIALGFIKFVEAAKKAKRNRIFPDIEPNSVGELMGNWSKWFGRYRRKECGLPGKDTPFHAFRHTFKHYMRLAAVPSEVHNELTGHETGDVADSYGGLSYPLRPLVEGMEKYRVPGLTLPKPPPAYRV